MTANILERLTQLDAATVHEAQGKTGTLPERLRPVASDLKVAGRAYTVDTRPGDNLALHLAVEDATPGDVLVVNAYNHQAAGAWGDILTAFAQQRQLAGLVLDGAVRDTREIVEMGFPVFASGVSIRGTNKSDPGVRGGSIVLDGQLVRTGDYILGDGDGVVVIPAEEIESVLDRAQRRLETEEGFRSAIATGTSTVDLLNLQRDRAEQEVTVS